MDLYMSKEYIEDVCYVSKLSLPWEKFHDKSIYISGASGLIGSFLIDVLMEKNKANCLNCTIYALGRNIEKLKKRFCKYIDDPNLVFIQQNIEQPIVFNNTDTIDYVVHLASNTHPLLYSTDPIGTILANVFGLKNLLDFSIDHNTTRFLFASSNEIYGENRGDVELFEEDYCGYINCNTLRAAYPESKRCGEALCQAYKSQKNLNVVISRLTRTFGPTMLMSDTKAVSQFIKNGLAGEDIVLKSSGKQYYSYTYVSDAVSGLLTVLLCGENGEAYNIADISGDITLKELAHTIADISGRKVIFEEPDKVEAAGFSKATKARLDGKKLRELGWNPKYDIKSGIERTMDILHTLEQS